MNPRIKIKNYEIAQNQPCFIIAEIGHNHQGNLKVALDMIKSAADCGVNAVKFQKRNNKVLYTKSIYNMPYDNEDSFGVTYGEHREFLEFNWDEYVALKECAKKNGVEFMCTAFDFESVDFLEKLGINSYKLASGDVTNMPLLKYIATLKKPVFLSTGASTLEEVRLAYETILKYHNQICLLHTVCCYPCEYSELNLGIIQTLKKEFPDAIIGYSGHDNGILASVIACMLGARVIEKHFTINHSWKGTDHKFSLEPEGLRKQVRDLRRLDVMLGDGKKGLLKSELKAKIKMGKSLYTKSALAAGHILTEDDICIKSPAEGLEPYHLNKIIGRRLKVNLPEESIILLEHLETEKAADKSYIAK
ncbi:MAG: N-acetylneuraminate synthase family protein [Candidatus Omnitrophica bacterium]|nr:N-acetylneuraminate synthase family protein [Candidatus Omnitrophota bacterium]